MNQGVEEGEGKGGSWDVCFAAQCPSAMLSQLNVGTQGLAKELFTDAGKYVVHFGSPATAEQQLEQQQQQQQAQQALPATPGQPAGALPPVTPMALARTDVAIIPTASGSQLVGG